MVRITTDKPADISFKPGQATEISININGWEDEVRPFTFTSLPAEEHFEFTIKTYPTHNGVTKELLTLKTGDELIVHDVFGAIEYRGEGLFIAGGAGVTPFIAILRELNAKGDLGNNKLIFANKTHADIILHDELTQMLGDNFINILSDEQIKGCEHGLINKELIKKHRDNINTKFYICGPPPMLTAVLDMLTDLHINERLIVKEGV